MRPVSAIALAGALTIGSLLVGGVAGAAPSEQGFEIGFRTGVMFPVGDAASGAKLSDGFGVQFPFWVDLGYRFGNVVVGAYGQWAAGLTGSTIDCGDASCSASAWRAGMEVQIHPAGRQGTVDPWFSLGFGYEWDTLHASASSGAGEVSGSATLHGWDIGRIGLGVDFPLTPWLRIGPFLHATVSEFTVGSLSISNNQLLTGSRPIDQKAVHSWITLGVKLTALP